MQRYGYDSLQKKKNDGKRVFLSKIYPIVLQKDSDIIYITKETDYLDSLAYKFYKDTSLWWIIALTNNMGKGKMSVEAGLQIRIPVDITNIINEYNILNK